MRFSRFIAVLGIACAAAISAHAETAKAVLKDKTGKDVGTVDLIQTPHGVLLKLSVKGIPAGEHANKFVESGFVQVCLRSFPATFQADYRKDSALSLSICHRR